MTDISCSSLTNSQEPDFLARLLATARLWRRRARERAALAQMDERALHDIGLSRASAVFEINKPLWRA